mmetsp:Transcript_33571/g.79161  ORF Transcript_33571/g.79161 Transcript_33571/m.79161 type:complete len:394 (-) Transcript_33571:2407-3588(-)
MSEDDDKFEVIYEGSVTKLFLAIEEMEWRDALDIIESDPQQARIWVRSSGTEHTTFDWSVWRRLPIHEACMRRAPAWLVSALLAVFPESASMTTNLGEYPLHLAVDKACAPEVVNLIIVANWEAVVAQDQAGRTPIDIIDQTELLELEANRIILESLQRGRKTYIEIQNLAHDEKANLLKKHAATCNAVSKKHEEDLKREYAKQSKLENEIEKLKKQIHELTERTDSKDHELQKHILAKNRWLETIRELEVEKSDQYQQLEKERVQIKVLLFQIEQKEEEIQRKDKKIDILSIDLKSIAISNETDILESLIETEQSMRTMVSNQIALQKLLSSKSKGLKVLLKQRGIDVPDTDVQKTPKPQEEKAMHDDDAIHDEAATNAMMAAAMAALQRKG